MIRTVLIVASLTLAGAAFGQNLITNPGFESGGTGWTLFTQGGSVAVASVTYPTTGARTGTRYARVAVTQAAASAAENWHVQFQPPTGWSAGIGTTYELKFWAKCDSAVNIHVSVQGSDYAYLTGQSFGLTSDWTEYTLTHVSDAAGTNAVRFHVYVAEAVGVYSFDDFSLTGTAPAGISKGAATQGPALRIQQGKSDLVLSLGAGLSGNWKAELVDLTGATLASATGRASESLQLARPAKSGAYIIRASTPTRAWVQKVIVR